MTARPLAGTDGASYPFLAPDGRAIGFFADGKLKRIDPASGGGPQVLADAPSGRGGTWTREGVLVFSPDVDNTILRVIATGGTPVPVTLSAPGEGVRRWPQFLPDGRHSLFFGGSGAPDTNAMFVATLDGGAPTRVLAAESAAMYAPPGALLWVRRGMLVAKRFDPARAAVSGEPIPVAEAVGGDRILRLRLGPDGNVRAPLASRVRKSGTGAPSSSVCRSAATAIGTAVKRASGAT